jgi:murein DD-endopeptidase MepM/ murein hydrolase activator NlpD
VVPASTAVPATTVVPAPTAVPATTAVPAPTALSATTSTPPKACPPLVVAQAPQPPAPREAARRHKRPAPARPVAPRPVTPSAPRPLPTVVAAPPPVHLLPIYRAAAARYGVRWEVLAAINAIETDFGRAMAVSSAGAVGWMQFLPSTWAAYGVDADGDGTRDPEDPVDAIFSAAHYLAVSGAGVDLPGALFAYNHADWYVAAVLARARAIARVHAPLADALAAIAGGHFPVAGPAGWRPERKALRRRAVMLYAPRGTPVVAVAAGRVIRFARSPRIGRYVVLEDALGTRFTYAGLGALAATRPQVGGPVPATWPAGTAAPAPVRRLFAHPARPRARRAGGLEQLLASRVAVPGYTMVNGRLAGPLPARGPGIRLRSLKQGSHVLAGTVLGRVGRANGAVPAHIRFAVRPRGARAGRIDPRPLLNGWRRLEIAGGLRPRRDDAAVAVPAALHWPGQALADVVLADPRITIYPCGREDVAAGRIDERVLATLEILADSGLAPTVSSLQCDHGRFTARGTISEHAGGNAVDVAAVNGTPILGHQGAGSITEQTILRLLELEGALRPHQIISLMHFPGQPQTLALSDHDDHIHIGFRPREPESQRRT